MEMKSSSASTGVDHHDDPKSVTPRLCHLQKWADFDGYGFNLHADKTRSGQFVGKVDVDSPAEAAGLREGDRIIEVNGVNVSNENHRQVVERIKAIVHETRLLVLDEESDLWCRKHGFVVKNSDPNVVVIRSNDRRRHPSIERQDDVVAVDEGKEDHIIIPETGKSEEQELPTKTSIAQQVVSSQQQEAPEEVVLLTEGVSLAGKELPVDVPTSTTTTSSTAHQDNNHLNNNNVDEEDSLTKTEDDGQLDSALKMSVSEVRQLLLKKKKHDPKKMAMDLRQKYDIISSM